MRGRWPRQLVELREVPGKNEHSYVRNLLNNQWLVATSLFVLMALVGELGYGIGIKWRIEEDQNRKEQINATDSSLFVLLSLLVSFSLTVAVSRYDQRRELVVALSNHGMIVGKNNEGHAAQCGLFRAIVFKSLESARLEAQIHPAGSSQFRRSPDSGVPKSQPWSLALARNEFQLALQAAVGVPACCEYQGPFCLTFRLCRIPPLRLRSTDKECS